MTGTALQRTHHILYSVALMGGHHGDTESTNPCSILIMPSAWLGNDEDNILRQWFDSTRVRTNDLPKQETDAQLIRPSRLVPIAVCCVKITPRPLQ